ncbi:hypothetical protein [Companilactobacillus nantensis]|uniref:Uncharacterized protein n=1 Tax=Companilactobacillus nantensis DSM 16982 TaxID=1423774 RepID=A0A0R1WK57_9LACO|nr:hypothetical protein [Companilactobacillus nantensis]KRM17813.1 hypothetical protein FD31_GL002333 [Companilactobacillus nantensis DSM 16982]GEO63513.1 hypothetical protein LNA01_06960 [Companilactobacillus nantensis]
MKKVYDMEREELRGILQNLFDNFNQYAKLYTLVEGDVYVHDAYNEIAHKFGKSTDDFETQIMGSSSHYKQRIFELQEQYETAAKKARKLDKKVKFEEGLIDPEKDNVKQMLSGGAIAIIVFWIISRFFPLAILGSFFFIWFEIKTIQATGVDKHREQLKESINIATNFLNQYEGLVKNAEAEAWSAAFEEFCNHSENIKLIEQAKETTRKCLNELNEIDFNNYALLPSKFEDNVSVKKSLDLLDSGQADNWKDCVQIMAQESIQQKQFDEMKRQTKNQEHIISNQEQMIHNQDQELNILNVLNKNVVTIKNSIKELATNIEKEGQAVNRKLTVVAANQGMQMFQAKRFHKEQLEEMRKSCQELAYQNRVYNNPVYYNEQSA